MIFDQYQYFKDNKPAGITAVLRCSGLSEMNGLLSRAKSIKPPVLVVEDAPDMKLNLEDRTVEDQSHTFYVLYYAGSVSNGRALAHQLAYETGKELLLGLNPERPTSIDKSDVFVFKVGPVGDGAYGYGFTYGIIQE